MLHFAQYEDDNLHPKPNLAETSRWEVPSGPDGQGRTATSSRIQTDSAVIRYPKACYQSLHLDHVLGHGL
jgi:hypothetical protein